ncbi:LysM peptidoglycan-binding domain-containing protein [Planctomycetota bacterium]|nr:LysM peptidoglycan-binding domain-containing protein [Planctomycetota bacterium]
MNSSYKIALLAVMLFFGFAVFFYFSNDDSGTVANQPTGDTPAAVAGSDSSNLTARNTLPNKNSGKTSGSSTRKASTKVTARDNSKPSNGSKARDFIRNSGATSGASSTPKSNTGIGTTGNRGTTSSRYSSKPNSSTSGVSGTTKPLNSSSTFTLNGKPASKPSVTNNSASAWNKKPSTSTGTNTAGSKIPVRNNLPAPSNTSTNNVLGSKPTVKPTTTRNLLGNTTRRTTTATVPKMTQYTVQPRDSMYKISKKVYNTPKYFMEIAKANPTIDPKRIKPGMKLNIPNIATLRAKEQAKKNPVIKTTTIANKPKAPAGSMAVHTVKSGETLSSISKKYYGTYNRWREIFNANKKKMNDDPDALQIGMKLVIPTKKN